MDINSMMKKAQEMQKKLREAQEKIADNLYEGEAGGGMIKATISGKGELKKLKVDPSLINDNEVEVIEDLIVAAFNKAKKNADEASESAMAKMMQDLGLPPMFKNMFN